MPRFVQYDTASGACGYEPPVKKRRDECKENVLRDMLAVVCNPWEQVDSPKFPDGKANFSVGKRHLNAEEVKFPDEETFPGETDDDANMETVVVALFAGINNHCVVFKSFNDVDEVSVQTGPTSDRSVAGQILTDMGNLILSNHIAKTGVPFSTRFPGLTPGEDIKNDNTFKDTYDIRGKLNPFHMRLALLEPENRSYSHWRPVSVGMRIKSLANETDDGGWWEAIRSSRNLITDRSSDVFIHTGATFGVAMQTHNKAEEIDDNFIPIREDAVAAGIRPFAVTKQAKKVANGNILPQPEFTRRNAYESTSDWGSDPSYCQGKISDLECMEFQLNCIRKDNDFLPVDTVQIFDGVPTWFAEGVTPNWVKYMNIVSPRRQYGKLYHDTGKSMIGPHLTQIQDIYGLPKVKHQDNQDRSVENLFSDAFDVILVRIHGTNAKTKLFIESICNREYALPSSGPYSEWSTPSFMDTKRLYEVIDYRNDRYLRPVQRLRKAY